MENRNYYYLVAGLPEIVPEQSKIPFHLPEFLELLKESLHPDDLQLLRLLFLPYDNFLLLYLARKEEPVRHPLMQFSPDELEEKLKEPGLLPAYMYRFFEAFRKEEPIWPGLSWENQLTQLYYEYVLQKTEGFLHEWFAFERDLKNILAAWNSRQFSIPLAGQLLGDAPLTEALAGSHARDFGLAREYPYTDRLLDALERDSLLEREKAIDLLKWHFIDEGNTFHYFSIEVILGYTIKLSLLERWQPLDAEGGERAVNDKIRSMEKSALILIDKVG